MGTNAIFSEHTWAAVPFHFWSGAFFVLGCIVGSFLNVCIHRMPLGMSIVTPPSHCPNCKYSIPWYLNIPLITWLSLRGRCKNCGDPISPRYFIVELLTGLAFLGCWLQFGDRAHPIQTIPIALVFAVFVAGLIVATFIDFDHFIIPDEITFGGIAVGLIVCFLLPPVQDAPTHISSLMRSLWGAAFGAGIVYAILRLGKLLFGRHRLKLAGQTKIIFSETSIRLPNKEIPYDELFYRKSDAIVLRAQTVELVDRGYKDVTVRLSPVALDIGGEKMSPDEVPFMECVSEELVLPREAMGLGDVKFMSAIGAFIGWQGVIFSLMVSSMIGAAVGLILIVMRRREFSSRMPYGPYIALAAVLWLFIGKKYYLQIFQ
ncbi:MAG TPA: prepilin peptidase [Candidatus Acidoferrum sp.]|jgi:leader peptidase (prepilin peptidase)/N-methyltransferase|nr:prepilin peptidase [Candidatus Acidoferrum sp.]